MWLGINTDLPTSSGDCCYYKRTLNDRGFLFVNISVKFVLIIVYLLKHFNKEIELELEILSLSS